MAGFLFQCPTLWVSAKAKHAIWQFAPAKEAASLRQLEGGLDVGKSKRCDPVTLSSVSLQPLVEPLWDRLLLGKVHCRPAP